MNKIIEPLTFYVTSNAVLKVTIVIPSTKKRIVLSPGKSYETSDKDEIDYLSKQKFIAARKLGDKEFRTWATLQFKDLPTVYNTAIETPKDVEEFVWSSEFENEVISTLKERGYIIYHRKRKEDKK